MGEYLGLVPPEEGFVQTAKFNFARFAEGPNYKAVNHDLIKRVIDRLPTQSITVDVATGHGMVPRLMADIVAGTDKRVFSIGVDLDPYAIEQARRRIRNTGEVGFVFLQGDARNLKDVLKDFVKPGEVDYTSIHDAIHEIRDDDTKTDIIDSMVKMLRPGGLLSYNSAFTTEAAGMEWGIWLLNFLKISGARRNKDIQGMPVHTPDFYKILIENTGLTVIHEDKVKVPLSLEELKSISEYLPFVRGFTETLIFPRPVEMEEGIEMMKQALVPTLDKLKSDSLVRKWHEIIAQKPF
ncbi:class I SAM-dependent methyltransferase [Candidatus Daviesbacteria bacterium]|nr:class I SAM-dependent methyltransferase [Candidatus Daviesbacteria bacterium]